VDIFSIWIPTDQLEITYWIPIRVATGGELFKITKFNSELFSPDVEFVPISLQEEI